MAVGDSLGLPYEGLSSRKKGKIWRQSFLAGWGVTSDDTQHAVMTYQSLQESAGDPEIFRKILGRRLAFWFLCLPPGIGWATLRASVKLCLGMRAPTSGVRSAGNGPAMRAPIIGWEIEDAKRMEELVQISTWTTHTDPRALTGAMAIAVTVRAFRKNPKASRIALRELWRGLAPDDQEWQAAMQAAEDAASVEDLLARTKQRKGVGGYIYHTVPVCLYIAEKERENFEAAVVAALSAGGDTDTVAAIVAALSASAGGVPPEGWLKILDFPTGVESVPRRLCFNLLALATILVWHVPKRLFTGR
jgi:ADP-ribosylglycohydrolase